MYYKKITIKNYKGIKDVTIDFSHNRILTLVGLNESGKTTILDGINLFYKLVKGMNMDNKSLNEIRPKGIDFTGTIELSAFFEFEKEDIHKLEIFAKEKSGKTRLTFPKTFELFLTFEFELHTYKRKQTLVNFDAKSTSSKFTNVCFLLYVCNSNSKVRNSSKVFGNVNLVLPDFSLAKISSL